MFSRSLTGQMRALLRALVPWVLFLLSGLTAACGDDGSDVDLGSDAGSDAAAATQSSTPTNPALSADPSGEPTTEPSISAGLTTEPSISAAPTSEPTMGMDSGVVPSAEPTTEIDSGTEPTTEMDSGVVPSAEPTLDVDGSVPWPDVDSGMPDASASAHPSEVPTVVLMDDSGADDSGADGGVDDGGAGDGGEPVVDPWLMDGPDGGAFDDGLLTNGSFDLGTDGWTAVVNPNGYDTISNFSWVEEGARAMSGMPDAPNAQAFYQEFTIPSGPITSARFSFYVSVGGFDYLSPETAQTLEIDPYGSTHDAFRVDIIASSGDVFSNVGTSDAGIGDAGGTALGGDAGMNGAGGDAAATGDAGPGNAFDVFTSPILFELYAPTTPTYDYYYNNYGVEHVVFDSASLASFLDSHQGETLTLRIGVVSSDFPVWGEFDNVSLIVGM